MSERRNYYVSEAATVGGVEAGVRWLQEQESQGASMLWLVSVTKGSLDGDIGRAVGEENARELAKGNRLRVGKSGTLAFITEKQLPTSAQGATILLVHPNERLLEKVDNLRDARSLAVVPWTMGEVAHWIDAHAPEDILGREKPNQLTVKNPVVERALESIWASINTSTGIIDPRDKSRVIEAFRILRKAREPYDPDEVRSWLTNQGMNPKHARKIAEVAANPSGFRGSKSSGWDDNILQQWRDEA